MAVRFEIDKARRDTFYHYKKYNDDSSVCVKTGWGIWSKQESDEEKDAWLLAVREYQKSCGVETKSNKIKEFTNDIRGKIKLDDLKFDGEKKPLVMPTVTDLITAIKNAGVGECTDDYINKIMGLAPGGVPSPKAVFQYSWNATWINLEIDLQEMLASFTKLGVSGFIYPVLDTVDEKSDELFESAYAVYDEVLRVSANAVYQYNRFVKIWGKSGKEEESEECKDKLITEMKSLGKKFGNNMVEVVFQVFSIQVVLDMLQVVKSGYNATESAWCGTINKIRALTCDDFKDMCRPCWDFLKSLLPLLAALAGAFIVCKLIDKKEIEQSREMSAENLDVKPDEIDQYLDSNVSAIQNKLSSEAVIYNKAYNAIDGFALQASGFNASETTVDNVDNSISDTADSSVRCDTDACDCKVSMCNFSDPVDASAIINRGILEFPNGVIVEIQKDLPYRFIISSGAEVNPGDIIAYIKDIPVKSTGGYKISSVCDNYFIAYETIDDNITNCTSGEDAEVWTQNMVQTEIDNADLTEYNKIIDAYTKFSYTDTFIRQYISYYRFPELAQFTREHVSGNATELSADDFIEEYEKYADDYYKQYESNVKSIASKKRVKAAAKRGKISEITNSLNDEKLKFKNNIVDLYNANPGGIKYCSKGRVADYMLYSNYLNYIVSDRFEYDEDNPYIKELYDCITDFIGTRTRIELNADNIKPLYVKFNEYCKKYIVNYWKPSDGNYYDHMCSLFKYDSYADTTDIIEDNSSISITLYKRVLKYLKSITNFSEDTAYSIEVNDNTDATALLEEQGKKSSEDSYSSDKLEFEKKLKQIAFRFTAIRKIELSLNNTGITTNVSKQLKAFNALHDTIGDELYEYTSNKVYKNTDKLYGKGEIIEPVLKILKEQTSKEASRLRELTEKCISWYNDNFDSLMAGDMFNSLVEIPWPDPSTVYLNNSKMKYYLFTADNESSIPPMTKEEREALEDSIGEIPETGEIDVTSPETSARIYDLKYWLKYCAIASLTGAVLPVFWATGIPIPVMLPTVYLPLVVVKGRVVLVAGLGVCGMAVLPMLMFVNTSVLNGCIITPINNVIDMVVDKLKQFSNKQLITAKDVFTPLIDTLNKSIEKYEKELETIEYQIDEIKKSQDDPEVKNIVDTIENNDTTFKAVESVNPNTGGTTVKNFALSPSNTEIDYDTILAELDRLSQYDNNFVSLESLNEEYGTAYQSQGNKPNIAGELTYDKFAQICSEMKCTAKTEVYYAIMSAFNESLRSLTIDNYDKTADLAAYLANTSVECGFKAVREYTRYSEQAILNTWRGSYFNDDGSPVYKTITTDYGTVYTKTAAQYASDGEGLFNYVYGTSKGKVGRLGNTSWGDGYKYRGGGFTQLTFKGNYESYDKFCNSYFHKNFNIMANPDNINNVDAAVYTSIAYWINRNGTRNLHNVWTANSSIIEEVESIQLNKNSMPCTSSKYPGVFKDGVSETQRKFTACYALVAGSYPTDNSSNTAKTTYIRKLSAFKKIYKILTT